MGGSKRTPQWLLNLKAAGKGRIRIREHEHDVDARLTSESVWSNRVGWSAPSLIGGERDPQVLASLARGRMRARHIRYDPPHQAERRRFCLASSGRNAAIIPLAAAPLATALASGRGRGKTSPHSWPSASR
jgi:hypothetical protein